MLLLLQLFQSLPLIALTVSPLQSSLPQWKWQQVLLLVVLLPVVDLVLPLVDLVLPVVDLVLPVVDLVLPVVDLVLSVVDLALPHLLVVVIR